MFAFKINYDEGTTPLYNGNISETYWKSGSDGMLRKYEYSYDNLNRLLEANYSKPDNPSVIDSYLEKLDYDKNGNITSLIRNGDLDANDFAIEIDDLEYYYDSDNKNQLLKVLDKSNHPQGFKDDSNGITDTGDDYDYDDFGNLIKDANKEIGSISYNHLNLPVQITFVNGTSIQYLYNATGQKIRKIVSQLDVTNTDYMGGFQYVAGKLSFFPHAEGYVTATPKKSAVGAPTSYSFNYVYQYKDHLGNNRLSFTNNILSPGSMKILEENHYYPFGLKHTNYNTNHYEFVEVENGTSYYMNIEQLPAGGVSNYKYKYNGKEYQDELGLNVTAMDFRLYDNALGRFHNIDKLAELAPMWTPYRFAFNNPVYWRDPTGLSEEGSNSIAICPTCPNNAKFKPAIDDPNRVFEYDAELDIAIEVTELNDVEIVGTRKTQTTPADSNSVDWAEYFNNGAGGFGTGLGFLSNQGGYFYFNRQWYTASSTVGEINIHLNYTKKSFTTGNPNTFKPFSLSKVISKGTIYTSVILEVPEVVDGFKESNKEGIKQTAGAAGGIFGGMWLGAKLGAVSGTLGGGPYVGVGMSIFGAVVGASFGEDAVEAVFDNIHNNSSFKGDFRAEPGLNGCFLAGTKVLMADGTEKAIENIVEGDLVMSYNFESLKIEPRKVLETIKPIHEEIVEIEFSNSVMNSNTFDHPYYVLGKDWSSYSPIKTLNNYGIRVEKIEIGDICYFYDKGILIELKVVSLKTIKGSFSTYNLSEIEGNHNFFANGILVHNKINNEK